MPLWHRTEWKKAPLPLKPFTVRKIRVSIKGAPELGEIMQKFIYSDVNNQVKIPLAQKELLTLVVLTANNTPEDIGIHVKGALNAGATPEEIRETIYQCTPYVGFARSKAALIEMQIAFEEAGVKLPLENQGTTTDATALPEANKRRLTFSATVCAVLQIPAKATRRTLTTGSAATASAITTPAKCLI